MSKLKSKGMKLFRRNEEILEENQIKTEIINRCIHRCNHVSRMENTRNPKKKKKLIITQLSTPIEFYKVMAVPVLMYGSENWSLNRSDKRKIVAAEMRFLRPMAGYTLSDKKRSSNIREQLGIFNINDKLTQYKINLREHIQRMDDNRLPKINTFKYHVFAPMGRFQLELIYLYFPPSFHLTVVVSVL